MFNQRKFARGDVEVFMKTLVEKQILTALIVQKLICSPFTLHRYLVIDIYLAYLLHQS